MTISSPCGLVARALSVTAKCNESAKRLLKVAIVGAPNAGKSTLLNRLVKNEISCVSKRVHTTRKNVTGVYTENGTQLEFYDSPGVITRQHMLRHRLEDSLLIDPQAASIKSDIVAVVVDANNEREKRRLNKGVLKMLLEHSNKRSILIINKVDLIKDKRSLLDIGTRLSQGCLNGQCMFSQKDLNQLTRSQLLELNLGRNLDLNTSERFKNFSRPKHKHVIELDSVYINSEKVGIDQVNAADPIGYDKFSRIFSISASNDDGVDELRTYMLDTAQPVQEWPHNSDYLTDLDHQGIVHGIIRGKVMDIVEHEVIPYLIKYKYLCCSYDEMGSLHVHLTIKCPENYMVGKVIGERGIIIFKIIDESRDVIANTLGCDVKLVIGVEGPKKKSLINKIE